MPVRLVLPACYSRSIVIMSHYMLLNAMVAYENGLHVLAALSLGGYLTSVNYWHCPKRDWRRTIDIIWINAGMAYHAYCAIYVMSRGLRLAYYISVLSTLLCYVRSNYWAKCGRTDLCTTWHLATHVVGVTANHGLYCALAQER